MEQRSVWEAYPGAEKALWAMVQANPDLSSRAYAAHLAATYDDSRFTKDAIQKKRKRSADLPPPPRLKDDSIVTIPGYAGPFSYTPLASAPPSSIQGPASTHVAPDDTPQGNPRITFGGDDLGVIYNDVHVPHQDEKAISILIAVLRDLQPTHLFDAGDFLDCARLGRFPIHPHTESMDDELHVGTRIRKDIEDAATSPRLRLRAKVRGNHEERLRRYLWTSASALPTVALRSLEECLGMDSWTVLGYDQEIDLGGFHIAHGAIVRKYAGYSAKAEFEARLCSGLSGHTHRAAVYRRTATGRTYEWWENGCLCRKDMDYVGSQGADWQHAFAIVRHDGLRVVVEQVVIHGSVAYVNGRKYTADS